MILYRIATAGRTFNACDKSGTGAALNPGRWNESGEYVLYSAPTIAMTVLETSAHITTKALPLDKYLVRLDVPDVVWKKRTIWSADELPADWDAIPAGQTSISLGSAWYQRADSALLQVPSVIVPEEATIVINCKHTDIEAISLALMRKYRYENLLNR